MVRIENIIKLYMPHGVKEGEWKQGDASGKFLFYFAFQELLYTKCMQ